MTLLLVPAWMLPTVRTAGSVAASSREMTVWRRTTIMLASTTGSTAAWGIEPWAPRPCTVTRMLSAAESTAPGSGADDARRHGQDVLGQRHVDPADDVRAARRRPSRARRRRLLRPVGTARRAGRSIALERARHQRRGAEQRGHVDVVPAGVHDRDGLAPGRRGCRRAGVGQAGPLRHRQGVHVGPKQDRRTVAVGQDADHPGPADAGRHLVAGVDQPLAHGGGGLPSPGGRARDAGADGGRRAPSIRERCRARRGPSSGGGRERSWLLLRVGRGRRPVDACARRCSSRLR